MKDFLHGKASRDNKEDCCAQANPYHMCYSLFGKNTDTFPRNFSIFKNFYATRAFSQNSVILSFKGAAVSLLSLPAAFSNLQSRTIFEIACRIFILVTYMYFSYVNFMNEEYTNSCERTGDASLPLFYNEIIIRVTISIARTEKLARRQSAITVKCQQAITLISKTLWNHRASHW